MRRCYHSIYQENLAESLNHKRAFATPTRVGTDNYITFLEPSTCGLPSRSASALCEWSA